MVEKAIQERQQKIVQAEGEAKAATLISFFKMSDPVEFTFHVIFSSSITPLHHPGRGGGTSVNFG